MHRLIVHHYNPQDETTRIILKHLNSLFLFLLKFLKQSIGALTTQGKKNKENKRENLETVGIKSRNKVMGENFRKHVS